MLLARLSRSLWTFFAGLLVDDGDRRCDDRHDCTAEVAQPTGFQKSTPPRASAGTKAAARADVSSKSKASPGPSGRRTRCPARRPGRRTRACRAPAGTPAHPSRSPRAHRRARTGSVADRRSVVRTPGQVVRHRVVGPTRADQPGRRVDRLTEQGVPVPGSARIEGRPLNPGSSGARATASPATHVHVPTSARTIAHGRKTARRTRSHPTGSTIRTRTRRSLRWQCTEATPHAQDRRERLERSGRCERQTHDVP